MPDLVVRRLYSKEEVHRVTVSNPFSTIRGQERYEIVMMGMSRNLGDGFYIDDSEIDKARGSRAQATCKISFAIYVISCRDITATRQLRMGGTALSLITASMSGGKTRAAQGSA